MYKLQLTGVGGLRHVGTRSIIITKNTSILEFPNVAARLVGGSSGRHVQFYFLDGQQHTPTPQAHQDTNATPTSVAPTVDMAAIDAGTIVKEVQDHLANPSDEFFLREGVGIDLVVMSTPSSGPKGDSQGSKHRKPKKTQEGQGSKAEGERRSQSNARQFWHLTCEEYTARWHPR